MIGSHPLDSTTLRALSGRQAHFAIGEGGAYRFHPEIGVFAALSDHEPRTLELMGALIQSHGDIAFLGDPAPAIPGAIVVSVEMGVQMIEIAPTAGPIPDFLNLSDADAAEMLALATLTKPGPFFARTHQLGDFIGIRENGRLIAMAGERMKPDGFTEVSGVCTHPDARGRGLAAGLTRVVAERIRGRGETPFLHAYASNTPAISIYRALGFELRRELLMSRLTAS